MDWIELGYQIIKDLKKAEENEDQAEIKRLKKVRQIMQMLATYYFNSVV